MHKKQNLFSTIFLRKFMSLNYNNRCSRHNQHKAAEKNVATKVHTSTPLVVPARQPASSLVLVDYALLAFTGRFMPAR